MKTKSKVISDNLDKNFKKLMKPLTTNVSKKSKPKRVKLED